MVVAPTASVTPPPSEIPAAGFPTGCAESASPACTPPAEFVERLCARPHQDAALALFGKQTPFTRLYVRGKVDELGAGEEVLVVRFHAAQKSGMVVGSGNGTYDVLRWDGTCSIGVEAEVFTRSRPARPASAAIKWHRLGNRAQEALIASSDAVKRAHARRGKECQGAMSGDVSAACLKSDQALVDAVVDYVRDGGSLPAPDALP